MKKILFLGVMILMATTAFGQLYEVADFFLLGKTQVEIEEVLGTKPKDRTTVEKPLLKDNPLYKEYGKLYTPTGRLVLLAVVYDETKRAIEVHEKIIPEASDPIDLFNPLVMLYSQAFTVLGRVEGKYIYVFRSNIGLAEVRWLGDESVLVILFDKKRAKEVWSIDM